MAPVTRSQKNSKRKNSLLLKTPLSQKRLEGGVKVADVFKRVFSSPQSREEREQKRKEKEHEEAKKRALSQFRVSKGDTGTLNISQDEVKDIIEKARRVTPVRSTTVVERGRQLSSDASSNKNKKEKEKMVYDQNSLLLLQQIQEEGKKNRPSKSEGIIFGSPVEPHELDLIPKKLSTPKPEKKIYYNDWEVKRKSPRPKSPSLSITNHDDDDESSKQVIQKKTPRRLKNNFDSSSSSTFHQNIPKKTPRKQSVGGNSHLHNKSIILL